MSQGRLKNPPAGYSLHLTGIVLILLIGFMPPGFCEAAGKIAVAVSIPPQAYFVERIGGSVVQVQVMIPNYADHDTYEPTPKQLVALANARIYFKIGTPGFPFETRYIDPAIKKNGNLKAVNMSEGITLLDTDPHIWMAPYTVRAAAVNIYNALAAIDPPRRNDYRKNLESFLVDIDRLDHGIRNILNGKRGYSFLILHPSLGYFAAQYGLIQISIESEGKSPSALRMREIVDTAKKKGIRIILVQKGFDQKSARAVAGEIGARTREIDPLAKNWLGNMMYIAETVGKALKP
ncbi:MAG: metal ABC transporter solute-binding protein, Zn/Mn family [Syntrophales bacterium]